MRVPKHTCEYCLQLDRLKWRCSLARIGCGILKVAAGTSGIVALSFPPVAPIFGSICTQASVGAAAFGATVTVFEQMSRSEQVRDCLFSYSYRLPV